MCEHICRTPIAHMNPKNVGNKFITIAIIVVDFGMHNIALSLHNILQGQCQRSTLLVPNIKEEDTERRLRLQQQITSSDLTVIFSGSADERIIELLGVTSGDSQYWIKINRGNDDDTGKITGTFIRRIGVNLLARSMNDLRWLLDTFCNLAQYQ